MLNKILSPLNNFVYMAKLHGVQVYYNETFVEEAARRAEELNIGVRGLLSIFADIKHKYRYDMMTGKIKTICLYETVFKELDVIEEEQKGNDDEQKRALKL